MSKPKQTDFRIINMVRDNPDLLVQKQGVGLTVDERDKFRAQIVYTASVVANIKARLNKFGECLVDTADLEKIWEDSPLVPDNANFQYRVNHMAEELDATVDWPEHQLARFIKNRHVIEVIPALN